MNPRRKIQGKLIRMTQKGIERWNQNQELILRELSTKARSALQPWIELAADLGMLRNLERGTMLEADPSMMRDLKRGTVVGEVTLAETDLQLEAAAGVEMIERKAGVEMTERVAGVEMTERVAGVEMTEVVAGVRRVEEVIETVAGSVVITGIGTGIKAIVMGVADRYTVLCVTNGHMTSLCALTLMQRRKQKKRQSFLLRWIVSDSQRKLHGCCVTPSKS